MPAGAYLLEVVESEIDVRVEIGTPAANVFLEDKVPRHGTQTGVLLLNAGPIRIAVRSIDHSTKRGSVALRIARWTRAPGDAPGELEQGYAAFGAAGELLAARAPADVERAADKLHEAIAHFESARDEVGRGTAAYALAHVRYALDDWSAAVRATEVASDAFEANDDEAAVQSAATLRAAAEIDLAARMNADTQRAEQQALYASAERRLVEAAEYFTKHGLRVRAQYAVNMRAMRAINMGDYDTAATLFERAVEMARANADLREQARSLNNLAAVRNYTGYMALAAREYEALLPLVDSESQPYQYAALLGNYGFTLIALGDFDRALALHTEALELYTRIGKEEERAVELAALGGLYFRLGATERALETLRAAIVAQDRVKDTPGLASTLRVAGNAAAALGQHATALEYLRRSARIDSNPHGIASTRVLIAAELRELGEVVEAEAELREPLASANQLVRASALEERARVHLARGNLGDAIADLRAADGAYTSLGLEFNRIDTNAALSRALLASKDVDGAVGAAQEAVSIATRIRVKSANPEWRARFLSARYAPYEALIAAQLAGGGSDAVWRAFRTAEEVRARSLSDELAVGSARALRAIDPEEAALRARLTSQQLRLESRIQRADPDESGTLALRRAVEETRARLDAYRLRHAAVAAGGSQVPDSLEQVRSALPADTAVLAFFVGNDQGHAWLLARDGLRHAPIPGVQVLQREVDAALREQREGSASDHARRRLANTLFGNLLEGVTQSRVLLLVDGPLNGVPFAALPRPGSRPGAPLVEHFVLAYAPSLALAMDGAAAGRREPGKRVAVVSDPVYSADDRRLRVAMGEPQTLRGPLQPSRSNLTRLPYSAMEAGAVIRAIGAADTIVLSGFDATPERVLQLNHEKLGVLHFATHAAARRDSPEQSALYLSEYSAAGEQLPDSRLTTSDITRSGLRADVVVLSGCATGDGSELRGEGVLGLTYGFLANGSQSVVASLWPIEDASTARFMNEFYRAYRETGRAADALRLAQLKSRATGTSTLWSSFVVRANAFP